MRFYNKQHVQYCGIDLHARRLYLCILNQEGETLVHRQLPCETVQMSVASDIALTGAYDEVTARWNSSCAG